MEVKLFEVRDVGTLIPVIAIRVTPRSEAERWLLARAGYGTHAEHQRTYILFGKLDGTDRLTYATAHAQTRTMQVAHEELLRRWDRYYSGDVLDVQFILGETTRPKRSEAENEEYPVSRERASDGHDSH